MSKAPDRSELAVERTQYAEDRNIMAMERTFAGWIRTAFAAIGIGIGFHALFGDFQPPWLAKAIATLFILAGAAPAFAPQRRARRTRGRLHPPSTAPASLPSCR